MIAYEVDLERFLNAISKYAAAYVEHDFRYLAVKTDKGLHLLKGRLYLRPGQVKQPPPFDSEQLVAGAFDLKANNFGVLEFTSQLLAGSVDSPAGRLIFPSDEKYGSGVHTEFKTLHEEGLQNQGRLALFTAFGQPYDHLLVQPEADWQVMGAPAPFQSLQELMIEYGIGYFTDQRCHFELAAVNVLAIDHSATRIDGEKARLAMLMAPSLDPVSAALNFRVESPGQPVQRYRIAGDSLAWSRRSDGPMSGLHETTVPDAAVVQCIATYSGQAHAFWWVADLANSQNPKRAIYESTDPGLTVLTDYLTKADAKGNNARNLESGVSWLLWMLGFGVMHLGSTAASMQDSADVIATSPAGHVAVVECTTGLLKSDKLALLVSRTAQFRERIARTGQRHLRVLPIFVTSRPRDEVVADIEQAQKLGVLVITREDLLSAIPRTLLLPNPEALYKEAEESARAAQQRALAPKLPTVGSA